MVDQLDSEPPVRQAKSNSTIAFALGGLAGHNAHGAGFLQAALDYGIKPNLISCTSGQILWVHRYLSALDQAPNTWVGTLEDTLRQDIAAVQPFAQMDANMLRLTLEGRPGVFRIAGYEALVDVWKNLMSAGIELMQPSSKRSLFIESSKIMPARTLIPLFSEDFFRAISDSFNTSKIAIIFNSYDPRQGIEFVHLNEAAKKELRLKPGDRKVYRDRTIYKDITPEYVRDGLWLYQYGFGGDFNEIDGAYYRQILLSEVAVAGLIYVARPVNHKWIGDLPTSFVALEDMKTQVNFNGTYAGERDKILLINKLLKERALSEQQYHHIDLVEIEISTQPSFFDYIFEKEEVFRAARADASNAFGQIQAKAA